MSVNNLLFSVQNMSPALLSVGVNKNQNYNNLADLSSSLFGNSSNSLLGSGSAGDSVTLTYQKIADSVINDMASVTASAIKQYPELEDEYVIAIVDNGVTREARVYKRSEILDNFEGTAAEKAALAQQLAENPLMVFNNANGLPETADDAASKYLAKQLNNFLTTNAKIFNTLDKAGYDPLADMLGSSTLKKILANYAYTPAPDTPKTEDKHDQSDKTAGNDTQTDTDVEPEEA